MASKGLDTENDLSPKPRIKLDEEFIRDRRMFKLAVKHCKKDNIVIAKQIVDRTRLLKELSGYTAQMRSIEIVETTDGEGEKLGTMSFLDNGFL